MLHTRAGAVISGGREPNQSPAVEGTIFLTSKQVRRRYGDIDETTLWRWTNHPEMGFPKPFKPGGRRNLWIGGELDAYDAALIAKRGSA